MPTNASPKTIYTLFLLDLCRQLFEKAAIGDKESLEHAAGALISFIPNKAVREILMNNYIARRDSREGNVFMATVLTTGEAVDYLTSALSLDEQFTLGYV
jgi:hypothetical protein